MMKIRSIGHLLLLLLGILGVILLLAGRNSDSLLSPFVPNSSAEEPRSIKPLINYSFDNLRNRVYPGSEIKIGKKLAPVLIDPSTSLRMKTCQSYVFTFTTEGKTVSGVLNLPVNQTTSKPDNQKYPVIVMIRGYADVEGYTPGLGTRKPAEYYCQNGFVTLAPDFLGFGSSDQASADILEARFEKPITVINLLASIKNPFDSAQGKPTSHLPINPNQVYLWGHSNGGQIVLSVLEITQAKIPTVLWAPVTKGFPENVMSFVGELDDNGLRVKNAIDNFLQIYDYKKYSIDTYFKDIEAPIQLHQGLEDPLVTEKWSDQFINQMKALGKDITYYKYPKNDHNLSRDWETVVKRDLDFYKQF